MTTNVRPSEHDLIRCAALHAHADLRVAIKMQGRGLLSEAWQKIQQGHDRLDKALGSVSREGYGQPCGDEEGADDE